MNTGTIARIGAAGFVVTALALSVLQWNEPGPSRTETVLVPEDRIDPLRAELRRCRNIGEAAASDQVCLRAWAAQRSRFFMAVHDAEGAAFDEAAPAAPSPPTTSDGSD